MKTGECAKILGVDVGTIRNWIDNPMVSVFFSPGAKGEHGSAHRVLSESDVLVLNTIRALRTTGVNDWDQIADYLHTGERQQEFPQNAISFDPRTIPLPQAEQAARTMAVVAERDAALERVEELSNKVRELERKLTEVEKERDTLKEGLLREIANLNREIGRLEGRLEAARDNSNNQQTSR